jgi:hypothetical protein
MINVKLFLRAQLLRYREHAVLVLRLRNSTVSSASAPTLQGTHCSCTTSWKFNCFFGHSSYVTGNTLFLYYVFQIQRFLRPQILRYKEHTVLVLRVRNLTVSSASAPTLQGTHCSCTTSWKFNCFFGHRSYVTGNTLFLYYVSHIQRFLRP